MDEKLSTFNYKGVVLSVEYIETIEVKAGVICDVYSFKNDKTKDLGIIKVNSGHTTPLQRVLKGDDTIEGFMSGAGTLTVISPDGKEQSYVFNDDGEPSAVSVKVGETMQWQADNDSDLTFYEICYPPYSDGRFENI